MHQTYSEIKDQYDALAKTMGRANAAAAGAKRLFDRVKPRSLVFLGCGSSYCIAKSLALAAQMTLRLPAVAVAAGDFMLHTESYCPFLEGALAVAVSRSGCTGETVAAVEHLKAAADSHAIAITCAEGSRLTALCDLAVEMPWALGSSACQTRSVSCMYAAGLMLLCRLAGNEKQAEGLERAVMGGPEYMESIEDALKAVAAKPWTHAVVLADAEMAGIAEEGALAFNEICRKPSGFHHLLDARHGPIALIGRDTLALAALTDGNQYELALLADVAKKGAEIVVYSDIPLDGLPDAALNVSFGRSLPHAARGLPFLLAAQLIAYHRAALDGLDPDRPEGPESRIKL
jgi:fructoselysine-6-P-deglycase FrlB-like protein